MAKNIPAKAGSKYGDLYRRLIFLVLALVVYRIGTHIPVPGIDPDTLKELFNQQQGGILGLFNMFSGGALSRFSVFALGIMPYISASIIMQMLSYVLPSLESLRKEGESGRRKITQYTRYGTLLLGLFQALGIAVALETQPGLVIDPGFFFRSVCVISLVTGTMFLMWLGEQITERGIGNGISIIIFAGIVAGLPAAVSGLFHRRDRTSVCDLHYCDRDAGDGFCCLHRKRTTPYYRQLCKTSGRKPYLRRPELLSSFEDKHGQRDSADLCIFADSLPGYFSQLVYQRRLHSLDS